MGASLSLQIPCSLSLVRCPRVNMVPTWQVEPGLRPQKGPRAKSVTQVTLLPPPLTAHQLWLVSCEGGQHCDGHMSCTLPLASLCSGSCGYSAYTRVPTAQDSSSIEVLVVNINS